MAREPHVVELMPVPAAAVADSPVEAQEASASASDNASAMNLHA